MRRINLTLLGLFALTVGLQAGGLIVVDEARSRRVVHPPIVMPEPPVRHWAPLEVRSTQVTTTIRDQVATTLVKQEFYNPQSRRLEGTFLFPVPRGAQIDQFRMEMNGKMVEAELLSAEKARGIYESIVRKMKDPALLEYSGRDLFKARIFPIEPHSTKKVTLSYSEVLPADSGLVAYRFPLNTEKYSAKPIRNLSLKVEIDSERPLTSIYSPSHPVEVTRKGEGKATIGFEASNLKPDLDFQLLFAREEGEFGLSLLTRKVEGEDGYFLMLVSPGAEMAKADAVPKDVVFVLDTSGSMAGEKLVQAKKALKFCVENLNDGDRFDVLRFSTEVEPLFDGVKEADKEARGKANEFIDRLKPIGGTAIDAALQRALKHRPEDGKRPYVVVFLTDGRPTIGKTDSNLIVRGVSREKGNSTRVFCFGIGSDVNTHLLDRITEETKAYSQYVLPSEDLELKVSSFYTKIKEPVLSQLKVQFPEGVRAAKMYPTELPDLFKGQQLVIAGRYSGRADGTIKISGQAAGKERTFEYSAVFPAVAVRHDFIPRLWGTRRVGYLLDEMRLHGENKELRDEITELARAYGIVTPYTSYLIVEDESRRNVPLTSRSVPRNGYVNGQTYSRFLEETQGNYAIAGARSSFEFKNAVTPTDGIARGKAEADKLSAPEVSAPVTVGGRARGAQQRVDSFGTESLSRRRTYAAERPERERARNAGEAVSRYVEGRTFYQNGSKWVDSEVTKRVKAKRVRVEFGTDAYFTFVKKHPKTLSWLALGQEVEFYLGGIVYEIYRPRE